MTRGRGHAAVARTTLVLALLLGLVGMAWGKAVTLPGRDQLVLVNTVGGLPGRWTSCAPEPCTALASPDSPGAFDLLHPGHGGTRLAWVVPGDPEATRALDRLPYTVETWRSPTVTTLILRSLQPYQGMYLVHRYVAATDGRMLQLSLQVPPGAGLQLQGGRDLAGPGLAGLGAMYADARAVTVDPAGQRTLATEAPVADQPLPAGTWAGVRGRFWTVLVQSAGPLRLDAGEPTPDAPELLLRPATDRGSTVELTLYGGPITAADLGAASPALPGMLYASLWGWLRALAMALAWLLGAWQSLVGNSGVAILLLSLTVKLLMTPLTWVAERWQADVNRTQSLLAPELAAIRRQWQGEEAHRRTLQVYARHGVSPWYTVKSLAGFLIQIPVFIAAFDMLGENFSLRGAGFLWIPDLSLPDQLLALPVTVPFFGGYLNLLPLVMTGLTVAAAWLQEDPSLAPELRRGQRWRLYGLAALFLMLLYTFPAGMVLYWTANNLWHLLRILVSRGLAGAPR